jgi:hypothetical protein
LKEESIPHLLLSSPANMVIDLALSVGQSGCPEFLQAAFILPFLVAPRVKDFPFSSPFLLVL